MTSIDSASTENGRHLTFALPSSSDGHTNDDSTKLVAYQRAIAERPDQQLSWDT